MPTFWSTSTQVHLSISKPLPTSGTASTRQSTAAPTPVDEPTTRLSVADEILVEDPLIDSESSRHLSFLGTRQDMPFFMARVGRDLFHHLFDSQIPREKRPGRLHLPGSSEQSSSETTTSTPATDMSIDGQDSLDARSLPLDSLHSTSGRLIKRPTSPSAISTQSARLSGSAADSSFAVRRQAHLTPSTPSTPVLARTPPLTPRSLSLTVNLSKASFLPMPDKSSKPQDILITVFFNGEFVASRLVPTRVVKGVMNLDELTQTFSGRKVDRTTEHKWVLVPPGQNPDGALRTLKRSKGAYAGSGERWSQISAALLAEAEVWGAGKDDDAGVMEQYLKSLALLNMPADVEALQKVGGQKYGIIDIVIAVGIGKKDPPSQHYLREPRRYLQPRISGNSNSVMGDLSSLKISKVEAPDLFTGAPARPLHAFARPTFASRQRRRGNAISQDSVTRPTSDLRPLSTSGPVSKPTGRRDAKASKNDGFPKTLSNTIPVSGPQGHAFDLSFMPAGATLPKLQHSLPSSTISSLQTPSPMLPPTALPTATPVRHSESPALERSPAQALGPLTTPTGPTALSAPTGSKRKRGDPLKRDDDAAPRKRPRAARKTGTGVTPAKVPADTPSVILHPQPSTSSGTKSPATPATTPSTQPSPTPALLLGAPKATGPPSGPAKTQLWTPSALNDDCLVTYATQGEAWTTLGGLGVSSAAAAVPAVYGPCRSERGGSFQASGVLMGVRFVVG